MFDKPTAKISRATRLSLVTRAMSCYNNIVNLCWKGYWKCPNISKLSALRNFRRPWRLAAAANARPLANPLAKPVARLATKYASTNPIPRPACGAGLFFFKCSWDRSRVVGGDLFYSQWLSQNMTIRWTTFIKIFNVPPSGILKLLCYNNYLPL